MSNARTVTIPALGRQGFSLGCLYDLSSHQIHVKKLWNEEDLEDEKLTIQEHGTSNFSIEISNSQEERCNALDVDANIKLDICGGAVVVEGSAKYVNASNNNSQVSSVTYTSKKVTKTKALNMGQLAQDNVTYRSILEEEKDATHVVSSITYGKNAHFKFESRVTDEEDKDHIAGRLKLAIESLKTNGEGEIDRKAEEKKFAEETSCEFFGDYSGIVPPFNLVQAKETILAIEGDETNSLGVPITVTLTPLTSLTSSGMKMVTQLSRGAVNEAARLLQDIEDIQVHMKTLEKSQTAANYFEYRTTIGKIANSYLCRGSELKSQLCDILPKIKVDGEDEQALMRVIREYDESPFSKANTLEWMKILEDEVIYVDNLIKLAKDRQVPMATAKGKFEGEKLKAMQGMFYFEAKFLSCLKVTGKEGNGEVCLRSGGVLDDDDFRGKFNRQFVNFTTAVSEGGLRNSDAEVKLLFFLEFMAEENNCDIKFFEGGYDALSGINTSAKAGSVKYEAVDNTVRGEIRPQNSFTGEESPVSKNGGFVTIQLRYREDQAEVEQSNEESQWDYSKDFTHPAEKTSFKLDLGELHHGLREGSHYSAQLRYQIRPGLASQWVPFQFRARERPNVKIVPSSPFLMEVGVAAQIDCIIEKGNPEPSVKWTRKGHKEDVLSSGLSLMFHNPTEEDQAVYCVEVENVAGSDKQEILVSISDTLLSRKQIQPELKSGVADLVKELSGSVDKLSIKGSHSAYQNNWSKSNTTITFDKVLLSTGVGELDPVSGIFKCGQTGTYQVSWSLYYRLAGGQKNYIFLYRNEDKISESGHYSGNHYDGNQEIDDNGSRIMLLSLQSGDKLSLQMGNSTGVAYSITFNVQLLAVD